MSSIRNTTAIAQRIAALESTLDDVEQLINFFVIESQRVVFAENVAVTATVRAPTVSDFRT